MRVGTYPTRDFATLGILLLPNSAPPLPLSRVKAIPNRVGRSFLPVSACRHADRTISSRTFRQRVRRMVSEDSGGVSRQGPDTRGTGAEPAPRWRPAVAALAAFAARGAHCRMTPAGCARPHGLSCWLSAPDALSPTPYDVGAGSAGYSGFPAYSQILQRP